MSLEKIVSGGQSGADRAALDWAIANGFEHGGWCPRGRRAEDGEIDRRYRLHETPSDDYLTRTGWNVRDSDATVIFSTAAGLAGGSDATRRSALELGRPCLHLSRANGGDPAAELREFVGGHAVRVLNVAGPRASEEPEVGAFVESVLSSALGRRGR